MFVWYKDIRKVEKTFNDVEHEIYYLTYQNVIDELPKIKEDVVKYRKRILIKCQIFGEKVIGYIGTPNDYNEFVKNLNQLKVLNDEDN